MAKKRRTTRQQKIMGVIGVLVILAMLLPAVLTVLQQYF